VKNLIVISCDELRGDTPSFMGNPDCKTPNLDNFAEKSVVFANHFTVHGKSLPSRIAMMTGRYSHTDGFRTIMDDNLLPEGDPNLLECLKLHGYETAYFGHNHVFQNLYNGNNKKGENTPDYHSFTDDYFAPLLERKHSVVQPDKDSLPILADTPSNFEVKKNTDPLTGFCDDNRADQAVHYLNNIRDKSRPFYMHLNFSAPHPVYKVEEPYFSMYDRDSIIPWEYDMPANAPLPLQAMRKLRTDIATERYFRQLQAVYYGMVTKVDKLIGKVIDAIDNENLWKDTVVLFWVDHGDFAGQYGLPEKWDTAMQDCIMKVPQIIAAPGFEPCRIESLTEHTDLAPTILELLGFNDDWGIHGESLIPIINGEKVKDTVFADGGHETAMRERFNGPENATLGKQNTYKYCPASMARTKMVRTDKWKLVVRETGGNELYDMIKDPDEMCNLYGQSQYNDIIMDLQLKLINWCLRTDTDRPYQPNVHA